MARRIEVAKDFSRVPAGRHDDDGPFNGARFRRTLLVPALRENDQVAVVLDDTEGFGSSFLDEAFGGLVRDEGFTREELGRKLTLISETTRAQRYKRKAENYIATAIPRQH